MTKRFWILALALICIAPAADAATLRVQATVNADVVRVGDLFAGAGEAANAVVGRAPAPGQREVFDLRRLRNIAVLHKVRWTPTNRYARAVVTRAGRLIEREEVARRLQEMISKNNPDQPVRVSLFNQNMTLFSIPDASEPFWLENVRHDDRAGRVAATIVVPTGAGIVSRVPVTGRVLEVVRVPVVTRRVARGEIVRKDDLRWTEMPRNRVRGDVITDPEGVIGKSARHSLRPGRPLRNADVQRPLLVTRGSIVTLMLETKRMTLTTRGKSMESGSLGQTIQVVNIRSKRVIEAVVEGPGRVRVPNVGQTSSGGAS